jgi:cell fate regulator YaaT (PSP1 superfamily)
MEHTLVTTVAGVRFTKVGKIYHFDAHNVTDLVVGDQVVVETSRGWQLGSVAQVVENMPVPEGMKLIDRRATPRDLLLRQSWQAREEEVLEAARKRANDLNLNGIKIVSAEYSFDGTRLTVMFSSESEEKYDLKSMRQDIQRSYAPSTVEMRQIGPRDVAKMLGGMGACGKETRCCSEFLCEFSSISIRMAKEQGISLTPTEITGMCGRLRCCLIYEYDQYTAARALLPKRNKRVLTPQGEGRVLDQVPIRDAVLVQLADETRREFTRAEIRLLDDNGAPVDAPNLVLDEESASDETTAAPDSAAPSMTMRPPESAPRNPSDRPNRANYQRPPRQPQSDQPQAVSPDRQDRPDRRGPHARGPQGQDHRRQSGPNNASQPNQPGQNRPQGGGPRRPREEGERNQTGQGQAPQNQAGQNQPGQNQPRSGQGDRPQRFNQPGDRRGGQGPQQRRPGSGGPQQSQPGQPGQQRSRPGDRRRQRGPGGSGGGENNPPQGQGNDV